MFVPTLFPLCHPAEWEEINMTLKNTQRLLRTIAFSVANTEAYEHLHRLWGLKGILKII